VVNLQTRRIFLLITFAFAGLLITGLTSELYLGDEVYHYRFAKSMYSEGRRVSFDPIYTSGNPPGFFYRSEPLWSGLLAILWKILGHMSFQVAEIYHTCFYALLLFFTYLLGKQIYGDREGIWACLLMASTPMAVAFGVLFYTDVPATAITTMTFYWIIRKKYGWGGLGFALMYLVKRNTCFLIPAMILVPIYFGKEGILKSIRNLNFLLVPLVGSVLWDMWWRYQNIENAEFQISGVGSIRNLTILGYIKARLTRITWGTREFLNSSLIDPVDLIRYLGAALIILVVAYFVQGHFRREKKEMRGLVTAMVGSYFVFFLFLFGFNTDIRYLFPIVPILCIMASRAISFYQRRWASALILIICLAQFGTTLAYIHVQRQMPAEIKEGFSYIRTHVSRDAVVMYPEYILLEATERRFIWFSFFYLEQHILINRYPGYQWDRYSEYKWSDMSRVFFWNPNVEDLKRSLRLNKVDYIVIKKNRIYDDSKVKHLGGYPRSFVQKMQEFTFLKLVFENRGMSIWRVLNEPVVGDYLDLRGRNK
jgi:4-amino-4-deoxy-L-arabinose transferase-like glycosyltransferase